MAKRFELSTNSDQGRNSIFFLITIKCDQSISLKTEGI